jgi:hypothetical protein
MVSPWREQEVGRFMPAAAALGSICFLTADISDRTHGVPSLALTLIALLSGAAGAGLAVSIAFWNWPRFVVPPSLRDEAGAWRVWREHRRTRPDRGRVS